MSMCVVHMQKMKMSAMGGIQSHNQREHESKKNKEIDYEKSQFNFDTVNAESINYQRAVKERIAELNLKKAVRKDAVVYCSFIVSSDREFFFQLGKQIHLERCDDEKARNWWDSGYTQNYDDMEFYSEEYQTECIREGAESFFRYATEFFKERYGEENVLNGTVHMDEATPHMHLGVVPVTSDGRLSAKDIFTPLELKQLQTDFAEIVGAKYGLERGKEGSQAKHLDEVTFKLKQRAEQLDALEEQVRVLQSEKDTLEQNNGTLIKDAERLIEDVERLVERKSTTEKEISVLEAKKDVLEADEQVIVTKFLEQPKIKDIFNRFKDWWKAEIERRREQREEKQASHQEQKKSVLGSLADYEKQIAEMRSNKEKNGGIAERQKGKSNHDRDGR